MRLAETAGTRTKEVTTMDLRRTGTYRSVDRSADHHHRGFPLLTAVSLDGGPGEKIAPGALLRHQRGARSCSRCPCAGYEDAQVADPTRSGRDAVVERRAQTEDRIVVSADTDDGEVHVDALYDTVGTLTT